MNSASAGADRWANLRGDQAPRIELVPPYLKTSGPEACELAELSGLIADPWQRRVLDGALGMDEQGNWTAPEVGLVVGRQSGKGACVEIATLNGLFLRQYKMVYTSHLMATSRKIRERIQWRIESVPGLDQEVKQIRMSNEEQSISLKNGARIDFVARTSSAARGWAGYDIIFFDEAFALTNEMVGAMMPIMFARSNWQIWYVSMAGMANSTALRQVRMRGINQEPELAYYEWSVDDAFHDAPDYVRQMPIAWAQANPALGDRVTFNTMRRALRSMDAAEFDREVLCAWDDPGGMAIIHLGAWLSLVDPDSQPRGGLVFALDVAEGLTSGAIGVAGYRADRIPHVEITNKDGQLDHRRGIDWMVSRAKELDAVWGPTLWMVDTSGPAGALLPALIKAGIGVTPTGDPGITPIKGAELSQACGHLLKAVSTRDQLRHLGQECVTSAIRAARKRNVGDGGWAFGRMVSAADITPVTVVAEALYGLVRYAAPTYNVLESVH